MDANRDSAEGRPETHAWPGPALFAAVLCAVIAFFWWFLS